MCSATFGDQMWSCRGAGLTRVLAAIRVRSGPVKLVFESPTQYKKTVELTSKQLKQREDAAIAAQQKKDALLQELEQDEQVRETQLSFSFDEIFTLNSSFVHCYTVEIEEEIFWSILDRNIIYSNHY